jgi:DNA-directed RNA polymerase specialized sigma24 family protein
MAERPKGDTDESVEGAKGDATVAPQRTPLLNLARRMRRAMRGKGMADGLDRRHESQETLESSSRETTSESDASQEDPDALVEESTSDLIERHKNGDRDALAKVMARHDQRLVAIASGFIHCVKMYDAAYDAEDAVNHSWAKVATMIERCQICSARDGHGLWKTYFMVLRQEILRQYRRYKAIGRTADRLRADWGPRRSYAASGGDMPVGQGYRPSENPVDVVYARLPPPEDLVLAQLELEALLVLLDDPTLQTILEMRIEEYTVAEIAERLDFSVRTIERKLGEIRECYAKLSRRRLDYA